MATNQIADEEIIAVGDKVDMVTQSGAVYRTMIEDRLNDGPFLAGVPNKKGVHMQVEQGDDVYLVFYRSSGRYIAHMNVVALEKRDEVRYMWMMQKTKAQRNQRREAYRLPVEFDVQIFEYVEDHQQELTEVVDDVMVDSLESVSCRDLSVTGIALLTKKQYEFDEKYLLCLHMDRTPESIRNRSLKESGPGLYLAATVKRCIPWRTSNIFNTGMQFFGMTEGVSDDLARYVLAEQQKQIKRRRRMF